MALVDRVDMRAEPRMDSPPHHVCALAVMGGVALMFASAPLAIWLVDSVFSALR